MVAAILQEPARVDLVRTAAFNRNLDAARPAPDFGGFQWMSPSGFSDPAPGHFGNCPAQGPISGPGYFDADIGLMKNFHFTEAAYVQFRTDFLNAFNNVNLCYPGYRLQHHF